VSTINQFKSKVFGVLFADSLVLACMCHYVAFDLAQVAVFIWFYSGALPRKLGSICMLSSSQQLANICQGQTGK